MKHKLCILILPGLEAVVCAQGTIVLANLSNSSSSPSATTGGLFWISTAGTPALITNDFNAAFYGGTDSSSLSPLATFLLSNGTAAGDNVGGPGTFVDLSGNAYPIPGATLSAFFQIQAWTGNFNSYAAAVNGGAPAAQSPVFVNRVSIPPGQPPDLTGMPAMILAVPEPSIFALVGLGGVCALLLCLWWKKAGFRQLNGVPHLVHKAKVKS